MLGRVIADKYELRRKIGQGGMGQVWEAHDRALERDVAIKLLADRTTAAFKARFQREARALAQVQSDHIVQVYDFGLDEDAPYMVMELLVGEDLETRMR
ncbi:MAG: protein kinase, partial [Myxococcales bacterium]|nr:protein kinase [Myxococcales bacterium]